jgi:hypothetical protein
VSSTRWKIALPWVKSGSVTWRYECGGCGHAFFIEPLVQVMSQVLVSVGLMVLGPVLLTAATKEKDRAMAYTLVLAGAVGLVYSAVRYFIGRQNPVRA